MLSGFDVKDCPTALATKCHIRATKNVALVAHVFTYDIWNIGVNIDKIGFFSESGQLDKKVKSQTLVIII